MVRGDDEDVPGREAAPERVAFKLRPEGRRALGNGAESLYVIFGEEEVVRARLATDVDAARFGGRDLGDASAATDVDDVEPASRRFGEKDRPPDRLDLGEDRAGDQVVADPSPAFGDGPRGEATGQRVALGVDCDDQAEFGRGCH